MPESKAAAAAPLLLLELVGRQGGRVMNIELPHRPIILLHPEPYPPT